MGHERIGSLPKSQRWQAIVSSIAECARADFDVSGVAAQTLSNVQQRFRNIERDTMTTAAFTFLVNVAVAARDPEDPFPLQDLLVEHSERVTPLKLAKALRHYTAEAGNRTEYGAIAECAATDALALWYDHHKSQPSLFSATEDTYEVWRQAANAAGFCELSRLFFARYVERYLNYFLEREASAVLTLDDRNRFQAAIQKHIDDISQHAFETSKIMQSYAAGWYVLNAAKGFPSEQAIEGFINYAFKKMRDELLAEGVAA